MEMGGQHHFLFHQNEVCHLGEDVNAFGGTKKEARFLEKLVVLPRPRNVSVSFPL